MNNAQKDISTCEDSPIPKPLVPEATCSVRLSERDAAEMVAAAETPPAPNEAALQAAWRLLLRHG